MFCFGCWMKMEQFGAKEMEKEGGIRQARRGMGLARLIPSLGGNVVDNHHKIDHQDRLP